jgi:ABC-type nitrate/sulfonate/bicarbonate transport system permease component
MSRVVRGGGFLVLVLVAWELLARSGWVDPVFTGSPSGVLGALATLVSDPTFWQVHAYATGTGFLAGWALAVGVGLPLGLFMGWYGPVRDLFEPLVMAFYSTPRIALVPLFVVWFGFGLEYKLVVVFLAAIFPVLLNTMAGVAAADRRLVRMSRSFGGSPVQVLATVVLPGAVPHALTGVRQSMAHGLTGVVVGEVFSAGTGVGYLMNQAAQLFATNTLFAVVVLLAATATVLNEAMLRLETRLLRWRPAELSGPRASSA